MKISDLLLEGRAKTPFTVLQAISSVLGQNNVTTSLTNIKPNQFLVKNVNMDDIKYISSKEKQEAPNVYRGGEVRPHTLSAFSKRTKANNAPDPMFKDEEWYKPELPYLGTLLVPLNSSDAADVASSVHEAYHAWIWERSKNAEGQLYANEKLVNKLTEKWVRTHLTGMALHVALETITHSKINYGHN